ncbi:MAG: glutathione S-transferase family protein [Alphaproteobacteria bacterium]
MLTLYGNLESGNVYKVRLLLAQLDIKHRRIDVDQVRGEPRSEAFLTINPIGKVPALQLEDGRILSESGAILYYLAQGSPFWPDDAWGQAQVLRWMFFEQYNHEPYIAVNRYLLRFSKDPEAVAERIAVNAVKGKQALETMERYLSDHEWFGTNQYTLADITLYAYTHVAHEGGFDLVEYPAVMGWLARARARPGHIGLMQETSTEKVWRLGESA